MLCIYPHRRNYNHVINSGSYRSSTKTGDKRDEITSRLNTQPTRSPVNASPRGLLLATHDSVPYWLARPLAYESFIHYNLPVYPPHKEQTMKTKANSLAVLVLLVFLCGLTVTTTAHLSAHMGASWNYLTSA